MKKRTVAIYTKYDSSEECLCAIYLANYIAKNYRYVKILTPDTVNLAKTKGLSYQWDDKIITLNKDMPDGCFDGYDCIFWLCRPDMPSIRLAPGTVTAYLFNPYNWSKENYEFSKQCDFTLIPSAYWMESIANSKYVTNGILWPFDPFFQCIPRKTNNYDPLRIFFPAFKGDKLFLTFLNNVVMTLKECLPDIKPVIGLFDKDVPTSRIIVSDIDEWRLFQWLRNTDCIVDLNVAPRWNLFSAIAGCFCMPWIGYNLSPNNDNLNNTRRLLIDVKSEDINEHVSMATPCFESVVAQLVKYLRNKSKIYLMMEHPSGAWEERRNIYIETTNTIIRMIK